MSMVFQPILDREGQLFGHEALMRVQDPSFSKTSQLLDLACQLDCLIELGRIARGQAAQTMRNNKASGVLFVNLHPEELHDEQLLTEDGPLMSLASQVVLEVTERASVANVRDLKPRVEELRAAGYRIAIDDLGSGYSGLTSFALLQPDIVKLDMSLVRDVHRQSVKQRLIRSVTEVCRDMNTRVVAEGVETAEEREALIDLGCDLYQGYLFGRPQPSFTAFAELAC